MWHDRRIIDEIASLDMPDPQSVVINHGAALVVRGIRGEHQDGDIDFSTSLENIQYCREKLGWIAVSMVVGVKADGTSRTIIATRDPHSRYDGHRWNFSHVRYRKTGQGRIYLPEQITQSDQDEQTSIRVANLVSIRETKLETGREKDEQIIKVIDQYLAA